MFRAVCSKFFRSKNSMIEPAAEFFHRMHTEGNGPAKLRMDNGGENLKLQKRMASADWKIPIKVEFTARNTPQQNSRAETSFTGLSGRARAMMNAANIPNGTRGKVGIEALKTAVQLDGLVPVTINGRSVQKIGITRIVQLPMTLQPLPIHLPIKAEATKSEIILF